MKYNPVYFIPMLGEEGNAKGNKFTSGFTWGYRALLYNAKQTPSVTNIFLYTYICT